MYCIGWRSGRRWVFVTMLGLMIGGFSTTAEASFDYTIHVRANVQTVDVAVRAVHSSGGYDTIIGAAVQLDVFGTFNVPTIDPTKYTLLSSSQKVTDIIGGAAWSNTNSSIDAGVALSEQISSQSPSTDPTFPLGGWIDQLSNNNSFNSTGIAVAQSHNAVGIPEATESTDDTYVAGSATDKGGYAPVAFHYQINEAGYGSSAATSDVGLYGYIGLLGLDVTYTLDPVSAAGASALSLASVASAAVPDDLPVSDTTPVPLISYGTGGPIPQNLADQLPAEALPEPTGIAILSLAALTTLRRRQGMKRGNETRKGLVSAGGG